MNLLGFGILLYFLRSLFVCAELAKFLIFYLYLPKWCSRAACLVLIAAVYEINGCRRINKSLTNSPRHLYKSSLNPATNSLSAGFLKLPIPKKG